MPATLPRRAAVVTAVAATAFGGAALAGGGTALAATPKTPTSMSIGVDNPTINPGGGAQITGELHSTKHVNNRHVRLLAKPSNATGWTHEQTRKTNKKGLVHFQVVPASTTSYKVKFKSTKHMQAAHSAAVTVTVADTTSLVATAGTPSIDAGQSDTISGVLSYHGAAIANATVDLVQIQSHHNTSKMATSATDQNGSVSFTVTPSDTTTYALVFHKTADNAGARSASITVHVRNATALTIRAKVKDSTEVIRGELSGNNHALANRSVKLEARRSAKGSWKSLGVEQTDKAGNVKFTESAPKGAEDYKLVFAGDQAFDGCHSGVVTVNVH